MNFILKTRLSQIKMMHQMMLTANDENIYSTWVCEVPDEPSQDDFEYIAGNDDAYNEVCDLFAVLVKRKGMRW